MNLWIRSQDKKKLSCYTLMQINEHYEDVIYDKANKQYESYMNIPNYSMFMSYNTLKRNAEKEKQKVYDNAKTLFSIISNDEILGSYHSETRALEILDEIQAVLNPQTVITLHDVPNLKHDELINKLGMPSMVYEMPKE